MKEKKNMKKEYMIPRMEVVKIQQQSHLLAGSVGASSLSPDSEGFIMPDGSILGDNDDDV